MVKNEKRCAFLGWVNFPEWWVNIKQNAGSTCSRIYNFFLDTIYLQEAKASSEVQNIITTNDELYRSLVADKKLKIQPPKKC